jgi:hypothetical protein
MQQSWIGSKQSRQALESLKNEAASVNKAAS